MGQSFKAKISLGRNNYPEKASSTKITICFLQRKIYQHTSMLEQPHISVRILASQGLQSRYFGRGINKVQNLSTTENEVKVT